MPCVDLLVPFFPPPTVDLTLNGGSSTKSSSRSYPSTSRLTPSGKRQNVTTSQPAEIRTQNPLPVVSAGSGNSAAINFFSLPSSRDALNIMVSSDPLVAGGASRHGTSADFSRQPVSDGIFLTGRWGGEGETGITVFICPCTWVCPEKNF